MYVVEQIEGWEGKEMMPAFDVKVHADGEIYRYLINNATFEAEIEIVKKDAETGKVIPASGIGFKVRNKDTGEFVIQRINYPTPTDIEIYYTDAQGKLMLPYALPYGNYEIIEQNTCFGYVLDSTPVAFKVDGSTDLVTVIKSNYAQKGTITISKFGEVFSSVAEKDGSYQPVYEIKGLEGAVYEVIAVEDVITLDGTTRYTKGQVVATITTGKDGKAMEMDIGPLFGLWFQSLFVGICTWALTICIFIITYGRMIEIYLVTSVAPIPMATMVSKESGNMGQNYLRSLFALAFQAFLIIVCVAFYAALVENIGLIEVMGLAVLPSRLKGELTDLSAAIVAGKDIASDEVLSKHAEWVEELKQRYIFTEENALDILLKETGKVFTAVLEDAGVYKCTEAGRAAFASFVEYVSGKGNV